MTFAASYEALQAVGAWIQEHDEDMRADLIRAAEDAEKVSPDLRAQLDEYSDDADSRDMMLMAMHAFAAGFLRGFEQARDTQ